MKIALLWICTLVALATPTPQLSDNEDGSFSSRSIPSTPRSDMVGEGSNAQNRDFLDSHPLSISGSEYYEDEDYENSQDNECVFISENLEDLDHEQIFQLVSNGLPQPAQKPGPLRISILAIGSRGDIKSATSLCSFLIESGHICRLISYGSNRRLVIEHDSRIAFVVIDWTDSAEDDPDQLFEFIDKSGVLSKAYIKQLISGFVGRLVEALLRSTISALPPNETDVIMGPPALAPLRVIAEHLQVPYIGFSMAPYTPSGQYSHPMLHYLPVILTKWNPIRWIHNRIIHSIINDLLCLGSYTFACKVRKEIVLDLPAIDGWIAYRRFWKGQIGEHEYDSTARTYRTGVTNLIAASPALLNRDPSWGPNVHIAGNWLSRQETLSFYPNGDLLDILDHSDGRPKIYICLDGSSPQIQNRRAFIHQIVNAALRMQIRVIFSNTLLRGDDKEEIKESDTDRLSSTGYGGNNMLNNIISQIEQEENQRYKWILEVYPYSALLRNPLRAIKNDFLIIDNDVPNDWIFERVDAIVHDASSDTVAKVFRAAKPSLVFPSTSEQFFWAKRLEDLSIGLAMPLDNGQFSVKQFQKKLENVFLMSDRAKDLAGSDEQETSWALAKAVDIIIETAMSDSKLE